MIKQQKDGTYQVTFSTRDKFNRKIKKQKSGLESLAKAKRIETEFIAELKSRQGGFDYAGMCFKIFLYNHYLPYCEEHFTDAVYLERTVHKWCQIIFPVKLEAITPNDLSQILKDSAPELSYSTLKKLKSYLSRIFHHACQGGLQVNPANHLKIPKRKEEVQAKVLTREEANLLIVKSKELKPEWHRIWAFQLFTGMRSGESFALLKTDVDLEKNLISVNKSWNSKIGVKCTKSGDWRMVPICRALRPLILEFMADHRNGEHLLPRLTQWERGDQARVLRYFCIGLGITPIRFHDLRATFITQMFANGASIAEVQAIVGHSELKTTQMYLRLAGVNVKGATECLSFVLPTNVDSPKILDIATRMERLGTQLAANA